MKKIILALSLTFSLASSAFAGHMGHVVAEVNQIDSKVESVTLFGDGYLSVKLRSGREITRQLTEENGSQLGYLATSLSNAELNTEHHLIVCAMMPNPMHMPALSVLAPNDGLRVVLPTSNCATPTRIYPTEREAYAHAVALKTTLITLATELANRK